MPDALRSALWNHSVITSRDNAVVKRARAVRDGRDKDLIFIEGVRLCEEAVRGASLHIMDCVCTEQALREDRTTRLVKQVTARSSLRLTLVSKEVFASLADTRTPQGVLLLAERPPEQAEFFKSLLRSTIAPLIVVLNRVNNPSNAGAMLRVAEAAGAHGVIATRESSDLFSPKALRGAMGSAFRVPLWTGVEFKEFTAWCREHEITTVKLDAHAKETHTEFDWTPPRALITGEEGSGFKQHETTDAGVRIPMREPVESLNVAVALGVVLYEAARQRNK